MPHKKSVPDQTPEQNSDTSSYAQAAGAYGGNAQKNSMDPRELEARVLLKAANMLQELQDQWNDNTPPSHLEETLLYNRKIWMMFYNTATENQDKEDNSELRGNIINLSNFIFKRELEILSTPQRDSLDALISINRQISAGLMNSSEG